MAETYRFAGVDIASVLTHVMVIDGNIGVPPMRQDDYSVPGRTGAVAASPWWGPRVITFGGIVTGSTRNEYQTRLMSLISLVHNAGRTYTLTRTLAVAPNTTEATARYVGGLEQVEQLSNRVGRVAFDVALMDGYWYDTTSTSLGSVSGTSSVNVQGNAPTQLVTVNYSVGAGTQRITNSAFPGVGRLTLAPGSNTLTVAGGGSVTISYKAAWL